MKKLIIPIITLFLAPILANESAYRLTPVDNKTMEARLNENQQKIKTAILTHPDQAAILKAWSITHNPYSKTQAHVRVGELYNEGEKVFIDKRAAKVKQELEGLGIKVNHVPKIAVCASGGGYRAMISFAGFLRGLEKSNLSKLLTYISALSGSTWTLGSWTCKNCPISEFSEYIQKQVPVGLTPIENPVQMKHFTDVLIDKLINLQPITPVDIYGGFLADKILFNFDPKRHTVRLSESAHFCMNGERFMPIFTSVITQKDQYEWMEYTPFEVGSSYLKAYVPTWAFGRKFVNGTSKDYAPEQSLGYLMGIWGSAFEVAFKDLIKLEGDKIKQSSVLLYSILNHIDSTSIGDTRLDPATVFNFSKGLPASPMKDEKYVSVVDAGLCFNLPLPPLLERKADIVILFDASASNSGGEEFKKACRWATERKFNIPKVDMDDMKLDERRITIFKDSDPNLPILIYMPLSNENGEYKNGFDWRKQSYTSTFNFKYKKEQFDELSDLAEFGITKAADQIMDVIKEVAARTN